MSTVAHAQPDSASLGGKAANLLRLEALGLAVPPFFCLPQSAFEAFTAGKRAELDQLLSRVASTNETELTALAAQIHRLLEPLSIPEPWRHELQAQVAQLGGPYLAVRSSALQEDSQQHSFAGLFHTSLMVPAVDVEAAVKRCWLSTYAPGVLGYCRRKGLSPRALAMGVIVQTMLDSRAAGVMMTADPGGDRDQLVVVAGYGVGEGIVGDQVETDTYRFSRRESVWQASVAHKRHQLRVVPDQGAGVHRLEVAAEHQDAPVLSQPQLHELAHVGQRLEVALGSPQDIEWAYDSQGRLFILQSRPLTTLPQTETMLFDNSNIVEGYPGITLPLSFTALKKGYERNFLRLASALGFGRAALRHNAGLFRHMVGYIHGRVYYNLSHWYRIVGLNPLLGRILVPAFDEMIGVRASGSTPSVGRVLGAIRERLQLARVAAALVFRYLTHDLWMWRYHGQMRARLEAVRLAHLTTSPLSKTPLQLSAELEAFGNGVFELLYLPLCNDLFLMVQVALTKRLFRHFEVPQADDLFNRLVRGAKAMESVKPAQSVLALAQLFAAHGIEPSAPPEQVLQRIDHEPALAPVRAAFTEHLRTYGDRCFEELKLEVETFREAPAKLVAVVMRYVAGPPPVQAESQAASARLASEQLLNEALAQRPVARWLLSLCLQRTRTLLGHRETARLDRARVIGVYRTLYRALAQTLVRAGVLGQPSDLYYLTDDELQGLVTGSSVFVSQLALVETIAARRRWLDACVGQEPPGRLHWRGLATGLYATTTPHRDQAADVAAVRPPHLSGTPSAAGFVEAEALVVDNPHAAPDTRGKILVARMTDPGWVFLMLNAAGLVVEKGSLLSHTAIIGRELGIPTIVGVVDATRLIHNGDRLRLDAHAGVITWL